MLDVQTTYQKLAELKDTVTTIQDLDYSIKNVANPLYRFNLYFWKVGSAVIAIGIAVAYAIHYAFSISTNIIFRILNFILTGAVLAALLLAVVAVFWIIFHLILFVIKQIRKNKPNVLQRKNELIAQRRKYLEQALYLENLIKDSVVPASYRTLSIVGKLNGYLQSGQAHDINEAIRCYELDELHAKIRTQQEQIDHLSKQNAQLNRKIGVLQSRVSRAQTSADLAKFMWFIK